MLNAVIVLAIVLNVNVNQNRVDRCKCPFEQQNRAWSATWIVRRILWRIYDFDLSKVRFCVREKYRWLWKCHFRKWSDSKFKKFFSSSPTIGWHLVVTLRSVLNLQLQCICVWNINSNKTLTGKKLCQLQYANRIPAEFEPLKKIMQALIIEKKY